MTVTVNITSFGYLHDQPPAAHMTVDLRTHFRDPHVSPELRHMTAHDQPVRVAVAETPGIGELVAATAEAAQAFLAGPSAGEVAVAIGCAGGRHRAPAVAETVANRLRRHGVPVTVEHRDIDKPVINR